MLLANQEITGLFAKWSKLKCIICNLIFFEHFSEMATYKHRYFSGHTRNPDGSVQFIAGKTKVGDAIDGVIKIFTIAVCALISTRLPEHI